MTYKDKYYKQSKKLHGKGFTSDKIAQKIIGEDDSIATLSRYIRKWFNKPLEKLATPKKSIRKLPKPPKNATVLVIGDLHTPFTLDGYLDHCVETYNKYGCDCVVFIGDVIDQHFTSFHAIDPDGYGAGEELDRSIDMLQQWYQTFENAIIIIGNHDRLVRRKAFDSGISKRWVRDYYDVLGTPNWHFVERYVIDNVQYIHGESGQAIKKAKTDMMSTVQGHLHTSMYTQYAVGANYKVFGCAVGCGIDHEAYAMDYSKNHPKPAIGCAVIFEGEIALNVPMEL